MLGRLEPETVANRQIIEVPSQWTTLICYKCGHVEKWDAAPSVMHTCVNCDSTWDQDYNAAQNILALGLMNEGGVKVALDPPRRAA